jgi:RNA polymerase sigma factor (sigma-70 family)
MSQENTQQFTPSHREFEQAIKAIRAGKKVEACRLLAKIIKADTRNIQAWLLLSYAVESKERQLYCLRKVLTLAPNHEKARERLVELESVENPKVEEKSEILRNANPLQEKSASPRPSQLLSTSEPLSTKAPIEEQNTNPAKTSSFLIPRHPHILQEVASEQVEQPLPIPSLAESNGENILTLLPQVAGEDGAVKLTRSQKKQLNKALYQAGYKHKRKAAGEYTEWIKGNSIYYVHHSPHNRRIVLVSGISTVAPTSKPSSPMILDVLVKQWLGVLTYTERKVLEYTYGLEEKTFSTEAIGRIVGYPSQKVKHIRQNALRKLYEPSSHEVMKPLLSLLLSLLKEAGGSISEAQLETALRNEVIVKSINPIGASHLIFELEDNVIWNESGQIWCVLRDSLHKGHTYSAKDMNSELKAPGTESIEFKGSSKLTKAKAHSTDAINSPFSGESSIKPVEYSHLKQQHPSLKDNKTPIEALNLSTRPYNALRRAGVVTLGQLFTFYPELMWTIKNMGSKSMQELERQLKSYLVESMQLDITLVKMTNQEGFMPGAELTSSTSSSIIEADLLDKIEAIPLEAISVERLGLSEATNRQLNDQGVKSVGQLLHHVEKIANNTAATDRVRCYLAWLVEQDEMKWSDEIASKGISPLYRIDLTNVTIEELFNQWLEVLTERERQVISWRFGLNKETLTLQEVGEQIGVTRERARQLEKRAVRTLQNRYKGRVKDLLRPFLAFLYQFFVDHGGLLSEPEIIALLEDEQVIRLGNIDPLGVILLICEVDERFRYHKQPQFATLNIYSVEAINDVQRCFTDILAEKLTAIPGSVLLEELKQTSIYEELQSVFSDNFFQACLRVHPEIGELDSGLYTLAKWSNRRLDEMIAVLRQLGKPAHYTVIAEKTNALLPFEQQATAHNIHAHMGRLPEIFVRVGHGIFGLAEWGLHVDGNLANAAYRVLKEAGKPLHIDVITREVLKTWQVQPGSVYAAIQNDDRFRGIGSGVYYLRDFTGEINDSLQIDFGDLYGTELARWQAEFDKRDGDVETDTQNQVDTIRSIGLDFFAD